MADKGGNGKDHHKPPHDGDGELADSIRKIIENLSPMYSECFIPSNHLKVGKADRDAFSPIIVSIGPIYLGKEYNKAIEEHKWRYLKKFLGQTDRDLKDCIRDIREREERARQCYCEDLSRLKSDEFTKMLLLDGAFIIELFLLHRFNDKRDENDYIFEKRNRSMLAGLRRDLCVLKNQLPFFVLNDLYNLAIRTNPKRGELPSVLPSLLELTYEFLGFEVDPNTEAERPCDSNVKHLLDAVRLRHLPSNVQGLYDDGREKIEVIPSATKLRAAGVKFVSGKSNRWFDVKFEKGHLIIPCFKKGRLTIPRFKLLPTTESLTWNLMAFEQFYYRDDSYCIDYITFMADLIKTRADAKLLIRKKIIDIDNWHGNEETLVALFNSFSKATLYWTYNNDFSIIRKDLAVYFRTPFHKLKRSRIRDSPEKKKN